MRFRVSNIIRLWPRPCTLWSSTKSGALSKTAELIPVLEKIKENQFGIIFKKEMVNGSYQLKLSWQDGSVNYYDEKMITIH